MIQSNSIRLRFHVLLKQHGLVLLHLLTVCFLQIAPVDFQYSSIGHWYQARFLIKTVDHVFDNMTLGYAV